MNEGHALPLCFYLLNKFQNPDEVRKRVVFTTHTPEAAGNEEHDISTLEVMGFFQGASNETILSLAADEKTFNYTLAALRMSKKANGVSQMHGEVSRHMWKDYSGICPIAAITNAQNKTFWMDKEIERAVSENNDEALLNRKKELKRALFKVVADQTGRLFSEDVLTIVWARRFAAYKRADLIMQDMELFRQLVSSKNQPVQIIWAGKPYPEDHQSIERFNRIFYGTKEFSNCAVLTGYEIGLSGMLKRGSDVWLNNPKMYREASGTSGMTAAMNGSINLSIPDGWIPEFAHHGKNCFLINPAPDELPQEEKDNLECRQLHRVIMQEVIPAYYSNPKLWATIIKQAISDVLPEFDSGRMAAEYYEQMYS
jgi:starch phosphorylase